MPGINYKALYDMSVSKDPEAKKLAVQAAKNMTPDELKEFFNFQNDLHTQAGVGAETSPDRNIVAGIPPETAVAAPQMLKGIAGNAIKGGMAGVGQTVGEVGKMWALVKGMEMMGAPREAINAVMLAVGLKGGMKGAAAEGEAAGLRTGRATSEVTMPMSEEEYLASTGRTRTQMPPTKAAPASAPPGPPNVQKSSAMDEVKADDVTPITGGVNVSPTGSPIPRIPNGSTTRGRVSDPAAFQRALEDELKWIQAQKGLTNSNASTSGYDAWVAEQEGQIPPVGTSLDQLATKGLKSLKRSPK